ncbi:P2Y purinoceptor 14-like [Thunnus albacares]|uniref:P2Y purinoceptor 14-like n=1 Tax=Thunnus albacares TaxID=8236 RepID=UPI001CF70A3E|nr:P2Y purinoceptor 14-like [Thunnus albacares]
MVRMFKVSDLLHFLPLHDSRTDDGPYAACFHPTTQTQLRGRTDIKVKEAAVKPSGKVVNVLRIGSAVDILQAGGQGHVISILIIILYETSTNMGDLVGEGETSVINQTNDDDNMTHCDQVDTSAHLFFMLVYSLVFLVGLVLNSFTMQVYFCSAQQQVSRIMMVYLKNLAVSDFLLCLYLPFRIINYTSNSITFRLIYCNFAVFGLYLNMYASFIACFYIPAHYLYTDSTEQQQQLQLNNLLTPASPLSRYLKIIHPFRTHILQTVQAARIISTVTWVFLLAIMTSYVTLLLLTKPPLTDVPDSCDALLSAQVNVFYKIIQIISAAIFLFVFVSLVFFYYSASSSVLLAQQRQPASSSCKELIKSHRKMLVLVSVFCICFVPYHLALIPYALLKRHGPSRQLLYYLTEVTTLLSVLNICLDPLIYFISCEAFRTKLNLKRVLSRTKQTPSTDTRSNEGQLSTISINNYW